MRIQVDDSPCCFICVHSAFTKQHGELAHGGEEGLSLYRLMNLFLWQMPKADTHLTTKANVIFFLHFRGDAGDSELARQIGRHVHAEFGTDHFL